METTFSAEKNKELNKIISTVIQMVESNGDSVINDFGIILDKNDNYVFVAESDTQRLRFIADVYGLDTIDKLTDKQKEQTAKILSIISVPMRPMAMASIKKRLAKQRY